MEDGIRVVRLAKRGVEWGYWNRKHQHADKMVSTCVVVRSIGIHVGRKLVERNF